MPRARTNFTCRTCGSSFPRWLGRCPDCGAWDALEESRSAGPPDAVGADWSIAAPEARSIVEVGAEPSVARLPTGLAEFDRVLGISPDGTAGIVPGSVLLVGGEPGVGKSTLLLQAAGAWARRGARVLYVSSEESAEQIRLRAERLELGLPPELFLLAETNLQRIAEQARKIRPRVLLVDSVQMIFAPSVDGSPGSVSQMRRCGSELVMLAKSTSMSVVLVGHVTKDGQLAGPRLLEHLVDAVIYFEGERMHAARLVRAVKNRFGATLELGIFEMTGHGLRERSSVPEVGQGEACPGSVICPVIHGSRCLLAEIQALTATGFLGAAKRKSSGLDANRLAMIIAVLEQHAGLRLADRDIFAQVVGGMRVVEPASDLALLLAVAGAERRKSLESGVCAIGEVGLSGRLGGVTQMEQRLMEAARLGFGRVLVPPIVLPQRTKGVEPLVVRSVQEAMEHLG
ncbi:MAG: DNA repair protein RadA [Phycisphaerales bacterium]|nr:DNA repair protein RadA [Phycisphaerales bacterium]